MKHYELMFIVKPTLTDEETKARFEDVQKIITSNGGEVVGAVDYGTRTLAYEIQKNKRGHYYLIYFKADGKVNKELERIFKVTEDIIRFMIIKYENKKEIAQWEKMVAKATA
jgi:small subunit ribosomal protein S6